MNPFTSKFGLPNQAFFVILATAVLSKKKKGCVYHKNTVQCNVFVFISVFSQGDKGTSWYIIWRGSVNVITHGKVKLFNIS